MKLQNDKINLRLTELSRSFDYNSKISVVWYLTLYSPPEGYRCFEITYCLHFQGWRYGKHLTCNKKSTSLMSLDSEDGGNIFLRSVSELLWNCTASHRSHHCENDKCNMDRTWLQRGPAPIRATHIFTGLAREARGKTNGENYAIRNFMICGLKYYDGD
jgi:hypothetical protein